MKRDLLKTKKENDTLIVDLPILLSKIYTNDNSKELKNNIKKLLNHLDDNKQITKQVYNKLNKGITYKNDS